MFSPISKPRAKLAILIFRSGIAGVFATLQALSAPSMIAAEPSRSTTLKIRISGIQEARGQLLIGVHQNAASFPSDWERAERFVKAPIRAAGEQLVEISGLTPGRLAIIVVHDLDGDNRMTKNMLGLPLEPFGTSNNPAFYGPPRFGAAVFEFIPDASINVRLVRL